MDWRVFTCTRLEGGNRGPAMAEDNHNHGTCIDVIPMLPAERRYEGRHEPTSHVSKQRLVKPRSNMLGSRSVADASECIKTATNRKSTEKCR
jgi:hypothetical protein